MNIDEDLIFIYVNKFDKAILDSNSLFTLRGLFTISNIRNYLKTL